MKLNIILTIIVLIFPKLLSAQDEFELLISSIADTSLIGLSFQETSNGDFLIQSNIYRYELINGVLIDGPPNYGTSLSKISNTGQIKWKRNYNTSNIDNISNVFQILGKTPSRDFLQLSDDNIILPYSIYFNALSCGSPNVFGFTYKKSISKISTNTGLLEDNNFYLSDTICSRDKILDIKKLDENNFLVMYVDQQFDSFYIEHINQNLEVVSTSVRPWFYENTFFDDFSEDSYLSVSDTNCIRYDYNHNLIQEVNFPKPIPLWVSHINIATSETYIVILARGNYSAPLEGQGSIITILNRQGDLIAQRAFEEETLVALDFVNSNQLIVLENKRQLDTQDPMPLPLNVKLLDLNLNTLAESDYGMPYIIPEQIKSLDNNSFAVLGTRLKSIIDINNQEANQVYFLKQSLSNLVPVSITSLEKKGQIHIFPNPFSDEFTINLNVNRDSDTFINIYNLLGQRILKKEISREQPSEQISLNSHPSGSYFLQLKNSDGEIIFSEKMIKN